MRLAFEILGVWLAFNVATVAWLGWVKRERREARRRIVLACFDGKPV